LRQPWLLVVCAVGGFAAQAQDYPTRSVKLITQGAAASGPVAKKRPGEILYAANAPVNVSLGFFL
jgi:hypothetical protein